MRAFLRWAPVLGAALALVGCGGRERKLTELLEAEGGASAEVRLTERAGMDAGPATVRRDSLRFEICKLQPFREYCH